MDSTVRSESTSHGLSVWLDPESEPLVLPWMWVRDHSEDETSFDQATKQRSVNTFALDVNPAPGTVSTRSDHLEVTWSDGSPTSVLPVAMLQTLRPARVSPEGPSQVRWRNPSDLSIEAIDYGDIVDTDEGLRRWLDDIERVGFGLVSGAPLGQAAAQTLAERIGYVRRTIFGDMWTLSSEVAEHADTAYGADTLEPHTDGSYSHDGPGTQMFVCEERTGKGGESVLVDGFAAAQELRLREPEAFAILSRVEVPAHYVEDGVELRASRPTIRLGSHGEIAQVTFNNYDRSPFVLPPTEMTRWYEAYRALHDLVTDRSSWWMKRLEPGDGVLFDNWRCLHGRMAYTGIRVFHGCYHNQEDLESRQRTVTSPHSQRRSA